MQELNQEIRKDSSPFEAANKTFNADETSFDQKDFNDVLNHSMEESNPFSKIQKSITEADDSNNRSPNRRANQTS